MKNIRAVKHFSASRSAALICGRRPGPLARLAPELIGTADRLCLVSDRNCSRTLGPGLEKMLSGVRAKTVFFELPSGNRAKNFKTLERLLAFMLKNGCSRRSVIIAAGGGSVTDLAGLAAALYMRGVRWISVPTTLLGQTDAGIGGKTAVDVAGGKKIAGAFHQPELTVCNTSFLDTLNGKELKAGGGELIKYALIAAGKLGKTISDNLSGALRGKKKELNAVAGACAVFKLDLVSRDEREEKDLREILNLGHTAGHAFEALAKGKLTHGEAVLWGLRYAASLSYKLKVLDRKYARRIERTLQSIEPPALPAACLNFREFRRLVGMDKKSGTHVNRFILIVRPGLLKGVNDIPDSLLRKCLEEL
jgi:3-dehydroquinate synthase